MIIIVISIIVIKSSPFFIKKRKKRMPFESFNLFLKGNGDSLESVFSL